MSNARIRLLPRKYVVSDADGNPRRVTVRDALRQYVHSLNFFEDRRRLLHAAFEFSHLLMVVPTIAFFTLYLSWWTLAAYSGMFFVLANFHNTIWYHRYCSHRAFSFAYPLIPKLCLWFNPLGYREEVYALVHHVHHTKADSDEDPNGPRLGWLGNYTASYFQIDTDISIDAFEQLKSRLSHIGMPFSTYESFRRWGCVEYIPHYLARWIFATSFWCSVFYLVGGLPLLAAWFAVQFSWHAIVRDFNFRGHGTHEKPSQVDGWDFDRKSLALNQRFYGYLAGEWHNNHHAFRASANTAFLRGQLDIPFLIIRIMKRIRLVSSYHDHSLQFRARYLEGPREHRENYSETS